jgi:hypothetical protein
MKARRLLLALTVANIVLLTFSFTRPSAAGSQGDASVVRGHALEIVDERGHVRASIAVLPADPAVKMPDGTTGYPETVLLRLSTLVHKSAHVSLGHAAMRSKGSERDRNLLRSRARS